MTLKRWLFGLCGAAVMLTSAPAAAQSVRLGLGADFWLTPYNSINAGVFELTLGVSQRFAPHFSIGGRFGGLVTTDYYGNATTFGVPLDLELRAHFAANRVYAEGLIGPWFTFNSDQVFRFHGAFGFGLNAHGLSVGLELGYLTPAPIGGLRVGFTF